MVNDNSMRLGGRLAARWARQAVERMRRQRSTINSINVFPVADGDTGSNMYATVKSAYMAVEALDGPVTLPQVVEAMAAGALRGARGNSGLILAVALRGVADELADGELNPDRFAAAIELAAKRAETAIAEPAHGTMLTVLHAMADTAREKADDGAELLEQIEAVRARSVEALRETTGQLDVLNSARVVDAGASGIVEIFDLLYLTVTGGAVGEAHSPTAGLTAVIRDIHGVGGSGCTAGTAGGAAAAASGAGPAGAGDSLELVFRLGAAKDRTRQVKRLLMKAEANSVVISWPMVHVHVRDDDHARRVLADVEQYKVRLLRVEDLVHGAPHGRLRAAAAVSSAPLMLSAAQAGAVAVRLGSSGGEDLVREAIAGSDAAVLVADSPEGQAIIDSLAGDAVHPVPTGSPIAMLNALAVCDPSADGAEAASDMADEASLGYFRLCFAGESAAGPLVYSKTDVLVLAEGRIRFIEHSPEAAAVEAVRRLAAEDEAELITIGFGQQSADAMRAAVEEAVSEAYPDADVEVFESGLSGVCADVGVQ